MELVELRLPTSKKNLPRGWLKNLLGAFGCLESLLTKKCGECKEIRVLERFYKDGGQKDGLRCYCKDCTAKYLKEYASIPENKVKMRSYRVGWTEENHDYILKTERTRYNDNIEHNHIRAAKYFQENKERIRLKNKARRRADPTYRLILALRTRLRIALKSGTGTKSGKTLALLGCQIEELWGRFEKMFEPGMARANYGKLWHVDHIVPIASFDKTDPNWQFKCFH